MVRVIYRSVSHACAHDLVLLPVLGFLVLFLDFLEFDFGLVWQVMIPLFSIGAGLAIHVSGRLGGDE
ncbi:MULTISPECIES: hypothetical protein [Azotobacter]|uniref:hypothetical protein n=1 Tax=Azotobacter TaxID=352 RepID=UPI0005A2978E|nr:hypothetical protein [Azotobacter vinelandii]WKN19881.1 hypothetical protein AVAEIV_002789 [Azotobacter vinelandii]GLK58285.1 hypothetical protein GCM10017624_04420 [Azotobacter vinelandii]SFY17033.1 hypothetical protein SAMN04244547_04289 [Azotobacter vinelandii]